MLSVLICALSFSQDLKVMSFNIRLSVESDKDNAWPKRKDEALALLEYYHPDFFGVQEALAEQMRDIKTGLKNYDFVGVEEMTEKKKASFLQFSTIHKNLKS